MANLFLHSVSLGQMTGGTPLYEIVFFERRPKIILCQVLPMTASDSTLEVCTVWCHCLRTHEPQRFQPSLVPVVPLFPESHPKAFPSQFLPSSPPSAFVQLS